MGVCELVHLGPLREEPWHHLPQRHADTLRSAWQLSAASLAADDSFLDGVDCGHLPQRHADQLGLPQNMDSEQLKTLDITIASMDTRVALSRCVTATNLCSQLAQLAPTSSET